MEKLQFDKNRSRVKFCPCGRKNRTRRGVYRFAPLPGFDDKGKCFTCGKIFLPDKEPDYKYEFKPQPIDVPDHLPHYLVRNAGRNFKKNNFVQFLKARFGEEKTVQAILRYLIGTHDHWEGATVFWQIDDQEKVRHGKIMLYDRETCKRVKEPFVHIHSVRSLMGLEDFNLKQCLFGLHLINEMDSDKVFIVEAEKTAVIMSICYPETIWMATSSITSFKYETLRPLREKKIIACPDKGAYYDWLARATEMDLDIDVDDFLEKNDRYKDGADLADVILDLEPTIVKTERDLNIEKLIQMNPAMHMLIDTFGLE